MHKRAIIVSFLSLSIIAAGIASATPGATPAYYLRPDFTDIRAGSEYYDAVQFLAKRVATEGYADGTFRPGQTMNRAEFVHIVTQQPFLNRYGKNGCIRKYKFNADLSFFSDVDVDAWYADDLCIAKENGIVAGFPDGTFRPAQQVTFAEASKMITSIFIAQNYTYTPHTDRWYEYYVAKLAGKNAIPVSILTADQKVKRGEVAEMLYRVANKIQSKSSVALEDLIDLSTSTIAERDTEKTTNISGTRVGVPDRIRKRTAEQNVIDRHTEWNRQRESVYSNLPSKEQTPSVRGDELHTEELEGKTGTGGTSF